MTSFTHYESKDFFFIRSKAANSVVRGRIRPSFELIPALMHVIVTCKYEKDPIKTFEKRDDAVFSIIILWELSVAMETRVLIRSGPKPNAAFPSPQ